MLKWTRIDSRRNIRVSHLLSATSTRCTTKQHWLAVELHFIFQRLQTISFVSIKSFFVVMIPSKKNTHVIQNLIENYPSHCLRSRRSWLLIFDFDHTTTPFNSSTVESLRISDFSILDANLGFCDPSCSKTWSVTSDWAKSSSNVLHWCLCYHHGQ